MFEKISFAIVLALFSFCVVSAQTAKFKINIDSTISKEPVSGRLLIFMTNNPKTLEMIAPDFTDPEAVYVSGSGIKNLTGGKAIGINADGLAFPRKFSDAQARCLRSKIEY